MSSSRARLRALLFIGAALAAIGLALAGKETGALSGTELRSVDGRFGLRGEQPPSDDVVVVAVDDVTFDELDTRWPFPRSMHGKIIDELRGAGARAIAIDIQFTEPSEDPEEDDKLITAVSESPGVILATTETTEDGKSNVFGGEEVLKEIGARSGNALLPVDAGGFLRRLGYDVAGLKSFAVVAAEQALGRPIKRADLGADSVFIDFRGPPRTLKTISYSTVFNGKVDPKDVRGKVVVVGPAAPSLQDIHPTSTTGEDLMAGVEIQASAIDTAMRGFPLQRGPGWLDYLLIVALGALGPLAMARLKPAFAVPVILVAGLLFAGGAQLAFNGGTIIGLAAPALALVLGAVAGLVVLLVTGAFERQRVRDMFARFVPESVVDEVLANADGELRLGGTSRDATVMFSDLRGFTTFSESRPPDVVIGILNRYLTAMTEVILGHGGTLVAYMGDGIMAVFGAPVDQPDHADRALEAARAMTGPALTEFNAWLASEHQLPGVKMGVGLNAGTVMSGNVGSERRMEYTCIGDTTNTAARLEGMTKGTGWSIYVADSVRERLTRDEGADLVKVDALEVRGRTAKIVVWSTGRDPDAPPLVAAGSVIEG